MISSQQPDRHSVLIVSPDRQFATAIAAAFSPGGDFSVRTEDRTFAQMNGEAVPLLTGRDTVIFTADPGDPAEIDALGTVLRNRDASTHFVAVTRNDASITDAQNLRELGVDAVLPLSISPDRLRAEVAERRGASRRAGSTAMPPRGAVIAVCKARGGVGATTVAVNLAYLLQDISGYRKRRARKSVALIDLDLQFGNANTLLDIEERGGLRNLLGVGDTPDSAFLQTAMQVHKSGLKVMCAPTPIAPLDALAPHVTAAMLHVLRAENDFVVVDMPAAMVEWIAPVVHQLDQLILVTDTSVPAVRNARRILDFYLEERMPLPFEVIASQERKPMVLGKQAREAHKVLETRIRHWLPAEPAAARRAADLGRPVVDLSPSCSLSKALRALARSTRDAVTARPSQQP